MASKFMPNYTVSNYSTRHSQSEQSVSRPGFELRISRTGTRTVTTVALPYRKVNTTQRVRPNEGCGIIRHQWPMILIRKLHITQGCTNPGRQAAVANNFLYGDAFICGSSVWKFLHVSFWSLEFLGAPGFLEQFYTLLHPKSEYGYAEPITHT